MNGCKVLEFDAKLGNNIDFHCEYFDRVGLGELGTNYLGH